MRDRAAVRVVPVLLVASMVAGPAHAQGDGERHVLRLELSPGMVMHSDTQSTAAFDARTTGQSFAHLRLDGELLPWRWPLGIGLHLELERASLNGSGSAFGDFSLGATAFLVGAGLAGRVRLPHDLDLRGLIGYGVEQLPLLALSPGGTVLEVASVRAHGPLLAFALRVPLGARLGAEVRGLGLPVALGGELGGTSLRVRRLRGGVAMLVRGGQGRWRWAASVGYDLERESASGTGIDMSGWRHIVGLGVELDRVRLVSGAAPVEVPVVPVVTSLGRVRGFVRAASAGAVAGLPIANATIQIQGLPAAQSGPDGGFVVENVPAGPVPLTVRAPGWKASEEVVDVPSGGEATLELALVGTHAQGFATIRGVVRSSGDGAPLAARIDVPGAEQPDVAAGPDGAFVVLVPPGEHTVRISAPGFEEQSKTLVVAKGEQAILNVDLQPR